MREIMRLNHKWAGVKLTLNNDDKIYLSQAYPIASVTRDNLSMGLQIMLIAGDEMSEKIDEMPDVFKEVSDKVEEMTDSYKEGTQDQRVHEIPNCPICQQTATYIPQYYRYYCYPCKRYL
jgi:hypothetical protein